MADTSKAPNPAPQFDPVAGARAASGWTGWVVFAGILLILTGAIHLIAGLVALFRDTTYLVKPRDLAVGASYTTWGWVHLVLGVVAVVVGLGLLAGNALARVVGVGLAVLSAVVNLAFARANPAEALIVIALDVVIVYAIVVHGRELRSQS